MGEFHGALPGIGACCPWNWAGRGSAGGYSGETKTFPQLALMIFQGGTVGLGEHVSESLSFPHYLAHLW